MFGNIMGMLRKRRRVDGEPETSSNSQTHQAQSPSPHRNSASMLTDDECTSTSQEMQINESDSDLLVLSRRQLATIDRLKHENDIKYCVSLEIANKLDSGKNSFARVARQNEQYNLSAQQQGAHFYCQQPQPQPQPQSPQQYQQLQLQPQQQQFDKNQQLSGLLQARYNLRRDHSEEMEIDSAPVPPPQEYSDSPFQQQHSESSMNFDYLSSLHSHSNAYSGSGVMDTSSSSSATTSSFRKGLDSSAAGTGYAYVDDRAVDRPFNLNERFVGVLDQLDARVEQFRKDALGLQEKKDFLLMSIDLIKTNDLLHGMSESEREEIACYIQRVNSRLSTVELNVRTVRDNSQEDSLSQINMLIDIMITLGDPVLSRQRCQQYLNACSSSDGSHMGHFPEEEISQNVVVDKKFESALLGCTLDDQKNIKKRLQALMGYLNKQTIRD